MLRLLFPGLTSRTDRGAVLFEWVTKEARQPHWYLDGSIPDTIDGRFAVLATIAALVLVRLEHVDQALPVALTERFVEAMEAEHREMGIGDPRLGRTVRKLVGSLSRRADLWRDAVDEDAWGLAARDSLSLEGGADEDALKHDTEQLRRLWKRLQSASLAQIAEGNVR